MWPRPRATAASSRSMATTDSPLRANTSTMPAPIVPRPTTPTRLNSRAIYSKLPSDCPRDSSGPRRYRHVAGQPYRFTGHVPTVGPASQLPAGPGRLTRGPSAAGPAA